MPLDNGPAEAFQHEEAALHKRTLRKLDFLLLPFLATLFLFNSLDKSNIGNAESAHFTRDIGLQAGDLNTAVALFFTFFVTLQPLGAALGRKYGMVAWVPSCMLLWGIATLLHVWVRARWQLYALRIAIGALEAGFYPVTVSYLSLFYTRFEFGRRLSLFYGQAAVGGALGGLISFFVFRQFSDHWDEHHGGKDGSPEKHDKTWQSWQVLFLFEGGLTIVVAILGYFWLPHSVDTAWFLTPEERIYAARRVIEDRSAEDDTPDANASIIFTHEEDEITHTEETHGLLHTKPLNTTSSTALTSDHGLSPHDVISAISSPKIWHILACNILSAIPVYAFQVFLPLILAPLSLKPNPALTNLLTTPPYICGAITLYLFASYSDLHRKRIKPILAGLALLLLGLTFVVLLPTASPIWVIPRYLALNVLFAGTFIASPLTVAWISGNTPSPGKRAVLLGINGWGNLAGVFSALLFQPKYAANGYMVPFFWTLVCVGLSALGYWLFLRNLKREDKRRKKILRTWDADEVDRERVDGTGGGFSGGEYRFWMGVARVLGRVPRLRRAAEWVLEAVEAGRQGDEKITFVYGL